MQLKMALKSSGASQASRTAMSSGRRGLTARGQPLHGYAALGAEVCAVGERVDPGVGAAAAGELYPPAANLPQRLFERFGHAGLRLLDLPAVVGRAVVAEL